MCSRLPVTPRVANEEDPGRVSDSTLPNPTSTDRAGCRAFDPMPLLSDTPSALGPETRIPPSRGNRAPGRPDASIGTLPRPDSFVYALVRKEVALSGQIADAWTPLQDMPAAEARIRPRHRPTDVNEVVDQVRSTNRGLRRPDELPVSERL